VTSKETAAAAAGSSHKELEKRQFIGSAAESVILRIE
jgi:hypothetical protein